MAIGVRIALMADGPDRDAAIKELKAYRRLPIWRPKKNARVSDPIVVIDERRFRAEMERLGEELPEYIVAGAGEAIAGEADPEEVLELNTRAAETAEEE